MKCIKLYLFIFFLMKFAFMLSSNLYAEEKFELTLEECIKRALVVNRDLQIASMSIKNPERQMEEKEGTKSRRDIEETIYRIKTLYYDLLLKKELMKLAEDVKNNFEKATEKAEKKLEDEDPDITLQDVLKLKLGLVAGKDELNNLEYDRKEIIESLKYELGIPRDKKFDIKSKRLKQEKIDLKKIKTDFDLAFRNKSSLREKKAIFRINKIYLKIHRAEDSIKIAREVRKVSRGLLVTNLANFDFGIGEAKDLFESLFIYMRSVKNYLTKVHDYNVSIAELSFVTGKELSNLVY